MVVNNLLVVVIDVCMFYEVIQLDKVFLNRLCFVDKDKKCLFVKVMFKWLKKLGIDKINFDDLIFEEVKKFV